MPEFPKQIYPPLDGTALVTYSGAAQNPEMNHAPISSEEWANMSEAAKYRIGVLGLMQRIPIIDKSVINGGVYQTNNERTTYSLATSTEGIKLVYEINGDSLQLAIETATNSGGVIIRTILKPRGLYPKVIQYAPNQTSLQFINVDEGYRQAFQTPTTKL